jgi:predicted metal-dependent phosphoesterase TrpH
MIDLHTHTDQSDGSYPPERIVRESVALGLEAVAIADHDTLAGYDLAAPIAEEQGLDLVCAVELSTRPETPYSSRRAPSVHLLGYFLHDAPSLAFREWLEQQQESRRRRNTALVEKLQTLGVEITLEEVQALGCNLTGRPHFARLLCEKGYVSSCQEAFDVYLADNAQAAVERDEPSLADGIQWIRAGGGIPVLAHPVRLPQRDLASLETLLAGLVYAGLQGIEVFHSDHSAADTALYLSLARRFRLLVTGGSDFHGENKPAVRLGTGINQNIKVPLALLEKMRAMHLGDISQRALPAAEVLPGTLA